MQETKPFYKTSEFWLTMLANVAAIAPQLTHVLPPEYGVPVLAVINGLYALSRGIAKSGNPVPEPPAPVVVVK